MPSEACAAFAREATPTSAVLPRISFFIVVSHLCAVVGEKADRPLSLSSHAPAGRSDASPLMPAEGEARGATNRFGKVASSTESERNTPKSLAELPQMTGVQAVL